MRERDNKSQSFFGEECTITSSGGGERLHTTEPQRSWFDLKLEPNTLQNQHYWIVRRDSVQAKKKDSPDSTKKKQGVEMYRKENDKEGQDL